MLVPPPINFGGEISGDEVNNGGFDPATITNVSAPTGTGGTVIEYRWQSSTDGITWTNIASSTAITYDPGAITVTLITEDYQSLIMKLSQTIQEMLKCGMCFHVISKIVTNYSITSPSAYTNWPNYKPHSNGEFRK